MIKKIFHNNCKMSIKKGHQFLLDGSYIKKQEYFLTLNIYHFTLS